MVVAGWLAASISAPSETLLVSTEAVKGYRSMRDCPLGACKMEIVYCTQCEALVINGSHTVILPLVTDAPPTHTLWVQFILSPSLPSYLCVVFIVYNEYTLWYPALIFGIPYASHCFCIISPFCISSYSIHKDTISGIYRFTVALYYVYARPLGGMNDHLGYILHVTQEEARFYQFVAQPISYILENINIAHAGYPGKYEYHPGCLE